MRGSSNALECARLSMVPMQALLGLRFGGLGLRFLSHHDAAASIASVLSFSGLSSADNIGNCSIQIPWSRSPMPSLLRDSPTPQNVLSGIMIQT